MTIIPTGHVIIHSLQRIHESSSTNKVPSSSLIALVGHILSHVSLSGLQCIQKIGIVDVFFALETPCSLRHAVMQSLHSVHILGSTTISVFIRSFLCLLY